MPWWWKAWGQEVIKKGPVQNMETLFNISRKDMQKLIGTALSRGCDHADLFFEYRINAGLWMEEDIIKDVSRGIVMGMGVRAVKADQVGYAYTDDIQFEKMEEAAQAAAFIANNKASAKPAAIREVNKQNLYPVQQLSVNATLMEKMAILERVNMAAKEYSSQITKVYASITDEMKQIMYFDSEGKYFTDTQPMVMLRVRTIAEAGDKRQGGGNNRGGRFGLEFYQHAPNTPEEVAREAARIAVTNLNAQPAPAGPQVVVLGPGESGVLLHEAVGHGLEADFNRKGQSNYANRIGEKVASPQCTIVDSGLFPNLRGSINIDDEGNLPTESVLIENGILRGYMHDSISARVMKCPPTGNGRRQSYNFPPIPRMTNTFLRGGQYSPDEIIASVPFGVYAKCFGGGEVDITKGDFTFGVYEAYLIENGKLTASLKDLTLIGNGPEVMCNVIMVGNDPTFSMSSWTCGKDGQRVPVSLGIPTVKVSQITVGGTEA
jgi:TldD protein